MPIWVEEAYTDYALRLPKDFSLNLIEIAAEKRTKSSDLHKIMQQESQALLNAVPSQNSIIALDQHGKSFSTEELAEELKKYYEQSQDVSFLIGGPEGLSQTILSQHQTWSLSKLTLPHPMVRVLMAEQIYRAWSILHNHPYHR